MSFTLTEIATKDFYPDKKSDELSRQIGVYALKDTKRYLPVRFAIARSLAIADQPPLVARGAKKGTELRGDTLFGTGVDLSVWVALIVEHSGKNKLTMDDFADLVVAHWQRGIKLLDEDWRKSDEDYGKFIKRLTEAAKMPKVGDTKRSFATTSLAHGVTNEIKVPIGKLSEDTVTKEKVTWRLNEAGGSPHSAIMGKSGTGKTYAAIAMLEAIKQQGNLPLLAFDFKGDLVKKHKLDKTFEAEVIEPTQQPVPLDVLFLPTKEKPHVSAVATSFRDSFANLTSKIGPLQERFVLEAVKNALMSNATCKMRHVKDALDAIYAENGKDPDVATNTMDEICEFDLFKPQHKPETFFKQSWVISLQNINEKSKTIVVNLMLDAFHRYLSSMGEAPDANDIRQMRMMCFVDEAHRILKGKLTSLPRLLRESRSRGGAIMLASQSPDDFSGKDDEFLDNMGLVVAFTSTAKPRNIKRIFDNKANLVAKLKKGECLARMDDSIKQIKAW